MGLTLSPSTKRTPISCLGMSVSPTAIIWFVVAVIVDSIQTGIWRAGAHISKKYPEIISPFSADRNASATIAVPFVMFWICAALNHVRPALIFPRDFFSESVAVLEILFFFYAAAAFCCVGWVLSRHKFDADDLFFSTVTAAEPQGATGFVYSFDSGEPVELLACKIFESEVVYAHLRMLP